jgi:hypothetical protein
VHVDTLWDALGLVILGVGVSLIGRYLRSEYHRQFTDNARANEAPEYELKETGLRRGAVVFLTFGAMLIILGIAIAGNEAVSYLLRQ